MRLKPKAFSAALGFSAIVLAVGVAVVVWNSALLLKVNSELAKDSRNTGITLLAYHTNFLSPSSLTLDLWAVHPEKAPSDVLRVLFQSADALKNDHFDRVVLSRRGVSMFVLSGPNFSSLGYSYSQGQNPIYLIRTLPEQLSRPDGSVAFGTWTGGWLGVMTKQIDDATTFAVDWTTGVETTPTNPPD